MRAVWWLDSLLLGWQLHELNDSIWRLEINAQLQDESACDASAAAQMSEEQSWAVGDAGSCSRVLRDHAQFPCCTIGTGCGQPEDVR